METVSLVPEADAPRFALEPFRALRLANSYVGDPVANRVFARPYRSVPGRLREWRRKRHLELDPDPALYVHEYTSHGVTVRGLVANLDLLSSATSVFPHEGTDQVQVNQLAGRMAEMSLNPAPILLMHRGPAVVRKVLHQITAEEPNLVYTDRADQLQRVWRITDPSMLTLLTSSLASAQVVIADGHHRYAAARQLRADHPGTGWEQTLVMLVDQNDTPLQLCAIHRTLPRLSLEVAEEAANLIGAEVRRYDSSHAALAKLGQALVLHDGQTWATLRPNDPEQLLVCWLHETLLPLWQVDPARVGFHHSATDALARAAHGVSVLLPAPSFEQVDASALSGHLLPEKATSFQPKPHFGVIMRELDDE